MIIELPDSVRVPDGWELVYAFIRHSVEFHWKCARCATPDKIGPFPILAFQAWYESEDPTVIPHYWLNIPDFKTVVALRHFTAGTSGPCPRSNCYSDKN